MDLFCNCLLNSKRAILLEQERWERMRGLFCWISSGIYLDERGLPICPKTLALRDPLWGWRRWGYRKWAEGLSYEALVFQPPQPCSSHLQCRSFRVYEPWENSLAESRILVPDILIECFTMWMWHVTSTFKSVEPKYNQNWITLSALWVLTSHTQLAASTIENAGRGQGWSGVEAASGKDLIANFLLSLVNESVINWKNNIHLVCLGYLGILKNLEIGENFAFPMFRLGSMSILWNLKSLEISNILASKHFTKGMLNLHMEMFIKFQCYYIKFNCSEVCVSAYSTALSLHEATVKGLILSSGSIESY